MRFLSAIPVTLRDLSSLANEIADFFDLAAVERGLKTTG
jgi:hypothetical protein